MPTSDLFQDTYRIPPARLPGYDYSQSGAYFITICTHNRQPCFGSVVVPAGDWDAAFVRPTILGQRVLSGWASIPHFAPFATPDAFVLMPDHVHGLLLFNQQDAPGIPRSTKTSSAPSATTWRPSCAALSPALPPSPAPTPCPSPGNPASTTGSCAPMTN